MKYFGFVFLSICVAAGCSAKVDYAPVTDDTKAAGIRYYQTSPYLLVYTNSKGGLKWQILYLPDQTMEMTAEPHVIAGRSELTIYFQNGVLASSTEIGDTTALPKAIISAIQSALPLLTSAFAVEPQTVPAPYLYKIVVTGNTIKFYGTKGDVPIIVPTVKGS